MLDSNKVDQFYKYIDDEYYFWWWPDEIILISPNHFHWEEKKVRTVCKSNNLKYNLSIVKAPDKLYGLWAQCDDNEKIFYSRWETLQTSEHWLWEHFKYIEKYFEWSDVVPVVTPSFEFSAVDEVLPIIETLKWNILVIASVDFAHYQPEEQTLQHDKKSIETLESCNLNKEDLMDLIDADCPACLYMIQYLAIKQGQKPEMWWRDSSSTILWKDMKEENTSRIFMWYK